MKDTIQNRRSFIRSGLLLAGSLMSAPSVFGRTSALYLEDDPVVGEIRIFAFHNPLRGWAACNGQLMQVNSNTALFSLLGTYYGGNGQSTFALPDLRGRAMMGVSDAYRQGEEIGSATTRLSVSHIPRHNHNGSMLLSKKLGGLADETKPMGHFPAANRAYASRFSATNDELMAVQQKDENAIAVEANGQAHNNMQPYLVLNFCISLSGIFPIRS